MNYNSSNESGNSNGSDKNLSTATGKFKEKKNANNLITDLFGCGTCGCISTNGRKMDKNSDYISSCANSSYYMLNHINNS